MTLSKINGKYVAATSYAEKDVPKAAGFRWDGVNKCWWTDDVKKAARLAEFAADDIKAELTAISENRTEALAASRASDLVIDLPVPDGLAYLPYQRAGIHYASQRPATLIGDEMGLGKTIQAIGVINADASIKNVLIICPASLRLNWKKELVKWLTSPMSIGIANGTFPEESICIINYDILKKHHGAIMARSWDLLVVDEAHYLKNGKAQRTEYVLGAKEKKDKVTKEITKAAIPAIAARRRVFMTGTPIVNRPVELFPLVKSLDPDGLGKNFMTYAYRYCAAHQTRFGWDFTGASHLDELQDKLRESIMVRRLKSQVLVDLPAKRRQVIEIPASGAMAVAIDVERRAWLLHEDALDELRAKVEISKASSNPEDYATAVRNLREAAKVAFEEISKVRHDTAVAKIPAVVEHVKQLLENVDKIVIFCHHHDVVNGLVKEFSNGEYGRFDGDGIREVDSVVSGGKRAVSADNVELSMSLRSRQGRDGELPEIGQVVGLPCLPTSKTRTSSDEGVSLDGSGQEASEKFRGSVRSEVVGFCDAGEVSASGYSDLLHGPEVLRQQSVDRPDRSGVGLRQGQHLGDQLAGECHQTQCLSGRVGDAVRKPTLEIKGGVMVAVLTGETKMADRQAAVERFQSDPSCRLFIGSIGAAGVGHTLTAASTVLFAELDWVPGNVSQCEDRCHRIGQTGSVLVQHLVLEGSLDARMAEILVSKQSVIDSALDRVHGDKVSAAVAHAAKLAADTPAVPGAAATTGSVSREQVEREALVLTAAQVEAIHSGLQILAGMCDGASSHDGMGFSKVDAYIGRQFALQESLSARQAVVGQKIVNKYRRQLPSALLEAAMGR